MNTEDTDMTHEVIEGDTTVVYKVADLSSEEAETIEDAGWSLISGIVEASPFSTEEFTENQSRPVEY